MNYFLDCGTHFFEGLKKLNDVYGFDNTWTIYSFESNPITYNESKKYLPNLSTKLIHLNKAISTLDGHITVHCDFDDGLGCGQGSNILSNPPKIDIEYDHGFTFKTQTVECINFSRFIIQELINPELVIIKMDIEGEEFNVLPDLLSNKIFEKVDTLYIEFHERFFLDKLEHYTILKQQYLDQLSTTKSNIIIWK